MPSYARMTPMSPSPPLVQAISIRTLRQDAVLTMRGYFTLALLPMLYLFPVLVDVFRDLPRVDTAPLASPLPWLAAVVGGGFMVGLRRCGTRLTSRCLRGLLAGCWVAACIGVAVVVHAFWGFDWTRANVTPTVLWVIAAVGSVTLLLGAGLFYYALLAPALATMRLLATRLPPNGVPLTAAMAAAADTSGSTGAGVAAPLRLRMLSRITQAIVVLAGLATTVVVLWLFGRDQPLIGLAVQFAAIWLLKIVWEWSRRLVAVDAAEVLKQDPRPPVLYLRSFMDDANLLGAEWDFVMRTPGGEKAAVAVAGAPANESRFGAFWRRLSTSRLGTSGGRLEEMLAQEVAGRGPFVAIGKPDEPLPQLGAARSYFTSETWQSAIVHWVDMSQLIVKAAGPTRWIRWELDTILDRDAWRKLIVLLPPGTPPDRASRWANMCAELHDTAWGSAFESLDPQDVVALRLLDGGRLSVVTGGKQRLFDYVLALRLLLWEGLRQRQP